MTVANDQVKPSVQTGEEVSERFLALLETQRNTFNIILNDFTEEKMKTRNLQQATMNILEDADQDRTMFLQIQGATINVLEDFDEEKNKFGQIQKAALNLMEDMSVERDRFVEVQRATMNMLDDIEVEREKVEQAKVLLELANKELEAFSYSVSHDLQAPLRAISGFSQAVLEDYGPKLDAQGKHFLEAIQKNAHDMGNLISSLLSFSRLSRTTMTQAQIDMKELAESVCDQLQEQAQERNIQFKVESLPPARGDKDMLRQLFVNLLANAAKFTKHREIAVIEVGFKEDGNQGAYYVKDNGAGFDIRYKDKLFGVFQRLHSAEEFEGTGVGLSIVARIVSRHNGQVWAEGAVDKGATFYFTLGEIIQ